MHLPSLDQYGHLFRRLHYRPENRRIRFSLLHFIFLLIRHLQLYRLTDMTNHLLCFWRLHDCQLFSYNAYNPSTGICPQLGIFVPLFSSLYLPAGHTNPMNFFCKSLLWTFDFTMTLRIHKNNSCALARFYRCVGNKTTFRAPEVHSG